MVGEWLIEEVFTTCSQGFLDRRPAAAKSGEFLGRFGTKVQR